MRPKNKPPRVSVAKPLLKKWKELLLHGSLEDLASLVGCSSRTLNTAIKTGYANVEMQQAITNGLAELKQRRNAELLRITNAQIEILKTA